MPAAASQYQQELGLPHRICQASRKLQQGTVSRWSRFERSKVVFGSEVPSHTSRNYNDLQPPRKCSLGSKVDFWINFCSCAELKFESQHHFESLGLQLGDTQNFRLHNCWKPFSNRRLPHSPCVSQPQFHINDQYSWSLHVRHCTPPASIGRGHSPTTYMSSCKW